MMTLDEYRKMLKNQPWFDIDEVQPKDGERCVTHRDLWGTWCIDFMTYFSSSDDLNYSWEGPGFYGFNEELFDYFKVDDVKYWLPIKDGWIDDE